MLQRVGRTPNLTLTVDTHTTGRYLCKASVDGYPEIEAEASVFIKGKIHNLTYYKLYYRNTTGLTTLLKDYKA